MNIRTFTLMETTNQSADFVSDTVDVQRDSGYSVSIKTSDSSTDFECVLELQASNDGDWGTIQGTVSNLSQDDTVIFNVSKCYYRYFRVKVIFTSGDADFLIYVTTKAN